MGNSKENEPTTVLSATIGDLTESFLAGDTVDWLWDEYGQHWVPFEV